MMSKDLALVFLAQSHRTSFLNFVFHAFSFLGEELFVVATVPLAFALARPRKASQFAFSLLATGWIVEVVKNIIRQPRPEFYAPGVALDHAGGFGFPSGHSAFAMVFWGLLALEVKNPLLKAVMALIICGIGISRIYLGVHFPSQVLAGWFVGSLILWFSAKNFSSFSAQIEKTPPPIQSALAVILPPGFLLAGIGPQTVAVLSAAQGLGVGLLYGRNLLPDPELLAHEPIAQKLARIGVTFIVVMIIYFGLRELGEFCGSLGEWFRWLRYATLGFSSTYVVPLICRRLSLFKGQGS